MWAFITFVAKALAVLVAAFIGLAVLVAVVDEPAPSVGLSATPQPILAPTIAAYQATATPTAEGAEARVGPAIEGFETVAASCDGPASQLGPDSIDNLRAAALSLINKDRADHDVDPVAMGSNTAAQLHADEMRACDYGGHWYINGQKPYMVYTQMGGTSYASENVAISWRGRNRDDVGYDDLAKWLEEMQYGMMYQDAGSDWGHRDNMLRTSHRSVNIGIAYANGNLILVQHLEGGAVESDGLPRISEDGELYWRLIKHEDVTLHKAGIRIAYDPPTYPLRAEQIWRLSRYCIGGGVQEECEPYVYAVLPPLTQKGASYTLKPNQLVATSWTETDTEAVITATLPGEIQPGWYTVMAQDDDEQLLAALSIERTDETGATVAESTAMTVDDYPSAPSAAEEKRKGFHCLSMWDGNNRDMEALIKQQLSDPGSMEVIGTRIVPVNEWQKHVIHVDFTARNAFGGRVRSTAIGSVDHETCAVTFIGITQE